jgi:hypothetical protein
MRLKQSLGCQVICIARYGVSKDVLQGRDYARECYEPAPYFLADFKATVQDQSFKKQWMGFRLLWRVPRPPTGAHF